MTGSNRPNSIGRQYDLPPLASLLAFEAAARYQSFKQAAEELEVTPSAISHQIKTLEQSLEVALFTRQHRGVSLTRDGLALYEAVQRSFQDVSLALDQIRQSVQNRPVTICATTALSSLWLTPRLTDFWSTHGDVPVNQHVSDSALDPGVHFDLRIWYGNPDDDPQDTHVLFRDRLLPVCSPEFAAQCPTPSLEVLASLPLIHLDAALDWTNWTTWFEALGHHGPINDGLRVNNYSIAIQSARDGVGVLLGWERLLNPLVERRLLLPLGELSLEAPAWFYLASEPDARLGERTRTLRDWLLAHV